MYAVSFLVSQNFIFHTPITSQMTDSSWPQRSIRIALLKSGCESLEAKCKCAVLNTAGSWLLLGFSGRLQVPQQFLNIGIRYWNNTENGHNNIFVKVAKRGWIDKSLWFMRAIAIIFYSCSDACRVIVICFHRFINKNMLLSLSTGAIRQFLMMCIKSVVRQLHSMHS